MIPGMGTEFPGEKIIIDRCLAGHGLWFDEGELREVLKLQPKGDSARVIGLLSDIFRGNQEKK